MPMNKEFYITIVIVFYKQLPLVDISFSTVIALETTVQK